MTIAIKILEQSVVFSKNYLPLSRVNIKRALMIASESRIWKVPPVNRREVLRRDHYTCQYCYCSKNLTLDHVIPLSKGGQHTWDNIVTACEQCNQRKSDRTPLEAGMPLCTKPKAPVHPAVAFAEQFWREQQVHLEQEETSGQC